MEDRFFLLAEQLVVIGAHELCQGIGLLGRGWELRSLECFESALPDLLRAIEDARDGFPEDEEESEPKDDDGCGPGECVDQGNPLGYHSLPSNGSRLSCGALVEDSFHNLHAPVSFKRLLGGRWRETPYSVYAGPKHTVLDDRLSP